MKRLLIVGIVVVFFVQNYKRFGDAIAMEPRKKSALFHAQFFETDTIYKGSRWLELYNLYLERGETEKANTVRENFLERDVSSAKEAKLRETKFKVDKEFFLESVNLVRAEGCNCGQKRFAPAAPLRWNDTLAMAAEVHSKDMDTKTFLRHRGSDGSNPITRANRQGYPSKFVGENIYFGGRNDERAFQAWMESPGHCANIMNPQFKEIGVAREGDYWTMVLGWK